MKDCTTCGHLSSKTNITEKGNNEQKGASSYYCDINRAEFEKKEESGNDEHFFDACYEPK